MNLDQIIKEVFNADESDIRDDLRLMQLEEWDSMAHMFFITRLEGEFGIELDGDEIASMVTVADVKKVLASKGKMG